MITTRRGYGHIGYVSRSTSDGGLSDYDFTNNRWQTLGIDNGYTHRVRHINLAHSSGIPILEHYLVLHNLLQTQV
jgi:hypothetical protein